ncbi:MAG: PcfJ domain-containing protein [Litorimonas sp.]
MARRGQLPTPEAWQAHILHVADKYAGRRFSNWYFENYPAEANRIYEEWLTASGLEIRRGKTVTDLASERRIFGQQRADWASLVKIKSQPLMFLQQVIEYDRPMVFFLDDQLCAMAKRLLRARDGLQDIDGFFEMLKHLDRRSKFIWADPLYATDAQTWLDPLIRLWHRRGQWRRPIQEWRPKSYNRERQFASLLRHLMADYDVPVFMDTVWLRNDTGSANYRDAWVHVGRGKNIRTAKALPMSLSKKAAHQILSAPEELTFEHALKWAHMQTFNLRPRACAALLGSRWGAEFEEPTFWDSVIRFLAANPMISPDMIGPMVDFIYAQKFEGPVLLIDGDEILRDDPPHAGFSMRGRDGQALLDQIESWHRELGRTEARRGNGRRAMDATYCRSGWKPSQSIEKLNDKENAIWRFVEILTESDLHEEGRKMRHCIYSYHPRVQSGYCSVWSLQVSREGGPHHGSFKRHLTVEVSSNGRINEARGFANKLPTGRAKTLLKAWAEQNRLSFAPYVFL